MKPRKTRNVAVAVFVLAAVAHFYYYGITNDHFDRITRAWQIAVFGDVPFRDFFDPGYFLTLYASALLQRVVGAPLIGEAFLNVLFMAAGTTIVFVLVSQTSHSNRWGLFAAALVVAATPRAYDYDKILFYPLGLLACWRYAERPTARAMVSVGVIAAFAGLFRYDSGLYVGVAAVAGAVALHWDEWQVLARRVGTLCLAILLTLAPALVFVQATAGLGNAFDQIATYAKTEGVNTGIFHPAVFSMDLGRPLVEEVPSNGRVRSGPEFRWLPGVATVDNAAAWLYYAAVGIAAAAVLLLLLHAVRRDRKVLSRLASLATLIASVVAFVLRAPLSARVAAVVPLIAAGGGCLAGAWCTARPDLGRSPTALVRACGWVASAGGAVVLALTTASIMVLLWTQPRGDWYLERRLSVLARVPPSVELLPKGQLAPVVDYLRECTNESDRVLATWFVPELYFFSGRGFAAGLPVVFGEHWSELRYQRRSLRLLQRQSVPVIVTSSEERIAPFGLLWDLIRRDYEMVGEFAPGGDLATMQFWKKRDRQVERWYAPLSLPCFAR